MSTSNEPETCYIIDGYNVMHADEALTSLMEQDLEAARDSLVRALSDFSASEGVRTELVFDAGRRQGGIASKQAGKWLTVTYTAQGQSADDYIEKLVYSGKQARGSTRIVVTGDYAQQRIVQGAGLLRMSPREFLSKITESKEDLSLQIAPEGPRRRKVRLADTLSDEKKAALERLKKQQK